MRSLCLVVLTLCATSAEAQPTLARDRAPAVPAEIRQFVDRLYAANASVRAEAACQLRKQHRDATAAMSVLLSMLADDITVPAIECHMSEWLRRQLPVSADARKWAETSPAKEAADTLGHIGDAAVPGKRALPSASTTITAAVGQYRRSASGWSRRSSERSRPGPRKA